MAKSDSNRDRIGKMFELLAPPLDEFISRAVDPELEDGVEWTKLVALKDEKKGTTGKTYDRRDPHVQLRMITENIPHSARSGWYPFDGQLGPTQRAYASELRDARNNWAHNQSFSDDDAMRYLDTAERFIGAIGAADVAGQVARIRSELRRLASEKDDRRALKATVDMPESAGLAPWRDVLRPHDDVATGNFQAAEFAADLYKVSVTSADIGSDYADPVEFFSRTYLTEGLRDLIGRAVRRLGKDDNASPVINLQTNFGGGKTHSMLALWHLAAGLPMTAFGQDLQDLLAECGYGSLPVPVNRVALVGNHISPSGAPKPDGTTVNTLWGELAWQLGGKEAFVLVAQSDRDRTPPGEALHKLIGAYAPAVILIDEWVAYARSLVARDDLAGGNFDDQFTFAQSLTEAVKGTPGVLLAISIPASESGDDSQHAAGNTEEVGGAHGLEALRRLQNVVRRVADQWRPASADESYHIVRQRLFVPADAAALASIAATARRFRELYEKHHDDFPREARLTDYEDRIKRTYPIHPELFDRLYEDWSSLERFQRTRGVLRLMNTVIHALWVGEDQSPLIMPASVPLSTAAVNAELTQYLQDSWKAIIDADVDGPNSEPAKIDTAKPLFGGRSVTKRLARTVFFGAAPTIGAAHRGLETQRVFLGTAVPGDTVGNFHSALNQLADRATYFYSGSGKYWYDLQANISRRAKDHADRLHKEDVWAEIAERLKQQGRHPGLFAGVHVCPEETGDILDVDEARLVIMHPRATHKRDKRDSAAMAFALRASEHRGSASRVNRNMVVFLAADEARMEELDQAVRIYLGWSEVLAKQDDLDLTQNQKNQAAEKQQQARTTVDARLLVTYQWALVPRGQPVTIHPVKVDSGKKEDWLGDRVSRRLGNDGDLATQQAGAAIRHQLNQHAAALWQDGHVRVGELWNTYAQYPYMPRLRDRAVLEAGLQQHPMLWENDGFALADGYDSDAGRYRGLILPTEQVTIAITDNTLVVRPDVAVAQRAAESAAAANEEADGASENDDDGGVGGSGNGENGGGATGEQAARKTRFFGSTKLSRANYAMDFKHVADEVLAPLLATPGVDIEISIEITATTPDGFDEGKIRTVSENTAQLKFETSGFEEL